MLCLLQLEEFRRKKQQEKAGAGGAAAAAAGGASTPCAELLLHLVGCAAPCRWSSSASSWAAPCTP